MRTHLSNHPLAAASVSALALALLSAGCIADEADDVGDIESAIEMDDGGFDMEDEAPMFGSDDLFADADLAEEVAFDDSMEADEAVAIMMNAPDTLALHTTILWGQFPPDASNTTGHNWTGTLSVNRGAIVVRRTIRFEPATDRIAPRSNPRLVGFRSLTRPARDGLRLTILDPTPGADEPLVLTYRTVAGPVLTATAAQLVNGPVSVEVDDAGNRIVALSIPQPVDVCQHGFLRGRWHKVAPDRGRFIGGVANARGDRIGHIRGVYGRRANGEKVFFGKYINTDGQFRGIFRGHYDNGHFLGRWHNRSGEVGALGGEYRESIPGPETGGHFLGRWAERSCDVPVGPGAPVPGE